MPSAPTVTREQVLAHRVVAQGLDRAAKAPGDLAIVDLGVQDSPTGTAAQSLAARLPVRRTPVKPPDDWVLVWSVRGAPLPPPVRPGRPGPGAVAGGRADAAARMGGAAPRAQEGRHRPARRPPRRGRGDGRGRHQQDDQGGRQHGAHEAGAEGDDRLLPGLQGRPHPGPGHAAVRPPVGHPPGAGVQPAGAGPRAQVAGVPDGHEGGGMVVDAYLRIHGPATPARWPPTCRPSSGR